MSSAARAEFLVSSAIIEFTKDGPKQQDIELISRTAENDYVVTEVSEIQKPGMPDEKREVVDDPAQSWLLVTPDKTILAGNSRKVLRFVLLKEPDAQEHIYRVSVKPVVNGLSNNSKVGLKILVGYEVLVIVRPANPVPAYQAERHGKEFTVRNTGNTNILFNNGQQCDPEKKCPLPPVVRSYAGTTTKAELPLDAPLTYTVWDGGANGQKVF